MKTDPRYRLLGKLMSAVWLHLSLGVLATVSSAFPPSPYNLLYGTVRDRFGNPLTAAKAFVVLQTSTGVQIVAPVITGTASSVNYRMKVPLDSGAGVDVYQPNALSPATLYQMFVVVGGVTNVPIQISGNFARLGQPAQANQFDLTLGTDSNGDGIPDAWESAFLAIIGANVPLSSINANSILTSDGMTLRQEYVLGTYPFNTGNPCKLTFTSITSTTVTVQFPVVTGRTYTILESSDLVTWTPVPFTLVTDGPGSSNRNFYYSLQTSTVQAEVAPIAPPGTGAKPQFYELLVK